MDKTAPLYQALKNTAAKTADAYAAKTLYHLFSLSYMKKESYVINAYLKEKESGTGLSLSAIKLTPAAKIRRAAFIIIAAIFLAGFAVFVLHTIGNIGVKEYGKYSLASVIDTGNAPERLEDKYRITYDLDGWKRELLSDDEYGFWEYYQKDGSSVSYRYVIKSMYENVRYNTEGSRIEERKIGDKTAVYYTSPSGVHCFCWDNGDYIFDFFFKGIEYDEALRVIESIQKE